MRFSKGLKLEIFLLSEEEIELTKLDIESKEKFYPEIAPKEIRTFYLVDVFCPFKDNLKLTALWCGATDSYVVNMEPEAFEILLEAHGEKYSL